MGYHRAGWEVVGVDVKAQPAYPFEFHRADALTFKLEGFDAIHASPPCQTFSRGKHLRDAAGNKASGLDLLDPTRDLLRASGLPYVIENVPGAPLIEPMTLCGSMFGLRVRRHRLFESSIPLIAPGGCAHALQGRPVGVYHSMNDQVKGQDRDTGREVLGGRTAETLEDGQAAMGIDWMPWNRLILAIPPAYTEWIGRQL